MDIQILGQVRSKGVYTFGIIMPIITILTPNIETTLFLTVLSLKFECTFDYWAIRHGGYRVNRVQIWEKYLFTFL